MFKPTPIEQLRRPHADQARIDAESARLLRETSRRPSETIPYSPITAPKSETGNRGSRV
ncbi:MAG TPA: hypothetical protein VK449_00455 [Anaerolineales bacterium]|nr:hypothetical protein [Anaerolineales bacterium]